MHIHLSSLPCWLNRKLGHWVVYPLILLTTICVIPISRIDFASGFTPFLPEHDPYRTSEQEVRRLFGANDSIIIALDVPQPWRRADIESVRSLTEQALQVDGTSHVIGLANMPDLFTGDGGFVQRQLYAPDTDPDLTEFTSRVMDTPMFRKFFVSGDQKALFTYAVPRDGVEPMEYVLRLEKALAEFEVHFFGDAVLEAYVARTVSRELVILGVIALLSIMIAEMILARSVVAGVVLSLVSAVPAIWTLAIFPLIGFTMQTNTMMVPVIVLVLSTSSGVHLYRYHVTHGANIRETLKNVSGVVISAGLTTMVGFLSLVVTPSVVLRQLGLLIIVGVLAGLVSSLVLFPPILARLPVTPGWGAHRRTDSTNRGNLVSMASRVPARPVIRVLLGLAMLTPFMVAIPSLRPGFSSRDTFRAGSLVADIMEYFVQRAQSNQQVQIVIDTGVEYGLVDMGTYRDLRQFESLLLDDPAIVHTTSFVDFVDWMNGRLAGSVAPVQPANDVELGEVMELLSGEGIGHLFETLVDVEWRRARILIRASLPSLGNKDGSMAIGAFRSRIKAYGDTVPSGKITLLGEVISNLVYTKYLARSQYISVLVFLPLLLLFFLFLFRSPGWAAVTIIPTVIGIIVYFGTVSMLGYLHDPIHVFMVAALMGVSNDDALYFVLVLKNKIAYHSLAEALSDTIHRTGVAILQTTLVITAGVVVFLASDFILLRRGGLVAVIALWSASLTTLLILPAVVVLLSRKRDIDSARDRRSRELT